MKKLEGEFERGEAPLQKNLASNVILRNEVTKNLRVGLVVHR